MDNELIERIKRWFDIHPDENITLSDAKDLINQERTNRRLFFEQVGPQILDELIKLEKESPK
jgi:hypothetical protein